MKLVIRAAMLGSVIVGGVRAGEIRSIHGDRRDQTKMGCPIAGADVGFYWWANGPFNDSDGKQRYDFDTVEGRKIRVAEPRENVPHWETSKPDRPRRGLMAGSRSAFPAIAITC